MGLFVERVGVRDASLRHRPFLDRVYTLRIERDVILDGRDGLIRCLVGPHCIDRFLAA
jgi:hypothetical protein